MTSLVSQGNYSAFGGMDFFYQQLYKSEYLLSHFNLFTCLFLYEVSEVICLIEIIIIRDRTAIPIVGHNA